MINTEIGSWTVERKLGEGGMGQVYLGRHRLLGVLAAIKMIRPSEAAGEGFRERFFKEAQTQAQLRHPHIAQVLDFIERDGLFCEVIEYMPGGTLGDAIQKTQTPPLPLVLMWAEQALSALQYAHEAGVVHRDVKPSNIMLDQNGNAKLVDFGIALTPGVSRLTATGKAVGTPEYMSPERITTPKEVDARSDIYSMGIVLFELLTGRPPFAGETDFTTYQAQVNDPPPSMKLLNPNVSSALEEIVAKALEKKPGDRYQTCNGFLQALKKFEQSQSFQGVSVTRVDRQPLAGPVMPYQGSLGKAKSPIAAAGPGGRDRLTARSAWVAGLAMILACLVVGIYLWRRHVSQKESSLPTNDLAKLTRRNQVFEERLLATLSEEELQSSPEAYFSPYGKSVAYLLKLANKQYVVWNGIRGPAFDDISVSYEHAFNKDGSKFAYYAKRGTRYFKVVNNEIAQEFQPDADNWFTRAAFSSLAPQFGPHGDTLLYMAPRGDKVCAIAGDWESPAFEDIDECLFSDDGSTIAYMAEQAFRKNFVVVGDRKEPTFDDVDMLSLSRSGGKVAYVAREYFELKGKEREREFVVAGDWRSPAYEVVAFRHPISQVRVSPDGSRLAYVVKDDNKQFVVLDRTAQVEYEAIWSLEFSPDSSKLVYLARQGAKQYVVLNGTPQSGYEGIAWVEKFSPDGSRVAGIAYTPDHKAFVVCGERHGPECDWVTAVDFDPDATQIGYGARVGRELWRKVLSLE